MVRFQLTIHKAPWHKKRNSKNKIIHCKSIRKSRSTTPHKTANIPKSIGSTSPSNTYPLRNFCKPQKISPFSSPQQKAKICYSNQDRRKGIRRKSCSTPPKWRLAQQIRLRRNSLQWQRFSWSHSTRKGRLRQNDYYSISLLSPSIYQRTPHTSIKAANKVCPFRQMANQRKYSKNFTTTQPNP